jgi:hypothetical protein
VDPKLVSSFITAHLVVFLTNVSVLIPFAYRIFTSGVLSDQFRPMGLSFCLTIHGDWLERLMIGSIEIFMVKMWSVPRVAVLDFLDKLFEPGFVFIDFICMVIRPGDL